MVNYMKLIKETIQQHPEINPLVIADVLQGSKDWLEGSYNSEYDDYVKRQYEYLVKFSELGSLLWGSFGISMITFKYLF